MATSSGIFQALGNLWRLLIWGLAALVALAVWLHFSGNAENVADENTTAPAGVEKPEAEHASEVAEEAAEEAANTAETATGGVEGAVEKLDEAAQEISEELDAAKDNLDERADKASDALKNALEGVGTQEAN